MRQGRELSISYYRGKKRSTEAEIYFLFVKRQITQQISVHKIQQYLNKTRRSEKYRRTETYNARKINILI